MRKNTIFIYSMQLVLEKSHLSLQHKFFIKKNQKIFLSY